VYALVADSAAPGRIARHVVPEPIPAAGEVMVDVRAISLNRGEMRMLWTATDGWRPGWDCAGVLRADIDNGPQAGTRVIEISAGRSWAERVAVPTGWVAELQMRSPSPRLRPCPPPE
jgi:NADPH2:quinone reductase